MRTPRTATLAIIGAGPAGLMAAEASANAGVCSIHVFNAMPSARRVGYQPTFYVYVAPLVG